MNKIINLLSISILLGVSACGGGSDGQTQSETKDQILVLGNSLSVQSPNSNVGWTHTSGMAATDASRDYVHLVASSSKLKLTVTNIGQIESDPLGTAFSTIPNATASITASTVVIIQLGDELNVDKRQDFNAAYAQLLTAAQDAASLICISTWWADVETDAMIKSTCEHYGGRYVYIGDIYPHRTDVTTGESVAVATRPHDPSMALIAQRIAAQIH